MLVQRILQRVPSPLKLGAAATYGAHQRHRTLQVAGDVPDPVAPLATVESMDVVYEIVDGRVVGT
jgi:hypothetical protein